MIRCMDSRRVLVAHGWDPKHLRCWEAKHISNPDDRVLEAKHISNPDDRVLEAKHISNPDDRVLEAKHNSHPDVALCDI